MSHSDPVNVLLVDDQPAKLLSYQVILEPLGETLLTATSARDALGHLLKQDVAVALIDVHMPELDGFELAAMIREHPRFQQLPLIFISAIHLSEFDRLKGYEAGGVDYVPVPVVPEVLRAKVKAFAELHRKTRELESLNAELERRVAERTADLETSHAELRRLNEELEARVEERTREREAALSQLFEAQKVDTIGQLTGGVAHDFNNLLMAMMGSLELLQKRIGGDATAERLLETARKGAERGAGLTQRLLAFARRQELRPAAVSFPDLMMDLQALFRSTLGPSIAIEERVPQVLPPVLADANQLELALMNLALNARDAMPSGGTLTISARPEDHTGERSEVGLSVGSYVRISVIDTGQGMDAETLARATEPFFTTKGVGKGTGLGLSMVHGLAAQSGGALAIRSAPGKGCQVDLILPVAREAMAPPVAESKGPPIERSLTILVVDDDPLVCGGTAAMLEDLGHAVIEANSAVEALERLDRGPDIELVITDHAMPGMTGSDLARAIREKRPDLPIILSSGYADLPHVDTTTDLPRLSKPFLQADLAMAIARHYRPSVIRAAEPSPDA
jgi:signal transduction histidine kinase